MTQTPTWVLSATPIISVLGIGLALLSMLTARSSVRIARHALKVNQDTYERAGSRLRASHQIAPGELDSSVNVSVTVWNSGLASISIDGLTLMFHDARLAPEDTQDWIRVQLNDLPGRTGESFPFVLAGQSSSRWIFAIHDQSEAIPIVNTKRVQPQKTMLLVDLGSGEVVIYDDRDSDRQERENRKAIIGYFMAKGE